MTNQNKTKVFQPRIATHWTEAEATLTYHMIKAEADGLDEEEITRKVQGLMADADKWAGRMIHHPSLQDSRDRMYKRWVDDASEMAAIWLMVSE